MAYRVLVVEDEPVWLALFQTNLCTMGYQVDTAPDFGRAKSLLALQAYDLVLLDVGLDQPGFNVLCQQFCEDIRDIRPGLPLFAMSGKNLTPQEMATLFRDFHPVDFVAKSAIDLVDFRHRIRTALRSAKPIQDAKTGAAEQVVKDLDCAVLTPEPPKIEPVRGPTQVDLPSYQGKLTDQTVPRTSLIGIRILFIGAHCDDIEIGCGGTAAKFAHEGRTIAFAVAADCGRDRKEEAKAAAAKLNLGEESGNLIFSHIPDGRLEERRDVLQNWLKALQEKFKPDAVFVHHPDTHPDHETLYSVSLRVFNRETILLFPIPKLASQAVPFQPTYYEDISGFIAEKLALCACHESQAGKGIYLDPEQIKAVARVTYQSSFGQSGGHAEAFRIHVSRSSTAEKIQVGPSTLTGPSEAGPTKLAQPHANQPGDEKDHAAPSSSPAPVPSYREVLDTPARQSLRAWAGGGNLANFVIVTTDIVGQSRLADTLGDAEWGRILDLHFTRAGNLVTRWHGFLVKTIGDAVLAVFRNCVEALDFALAFEADTGDHRVRIRAGINAGQVNVAENDIRGSNVDIAFRVTDKAADGGIWVNHPVKEDVEKHDPSRPMQWTEHPNQELEGRRGRLTLWSLPPSSCPPAPATVGVGIVLTQKHVEVLTFTSAYVGFETRLREADDHVAEFWPTFGSIQYPVGEKEFFRLLSHLEMFGYVVKRTKVHPNDSTEYLITWNVTPEGEAFLAYAHKIPHS